MMVSGLSLMVIVIAQVAGFFLLALCQQRHWQTVIGHSTRSRPVARFLRTGGMGFLVLSLPLAWLRDGAGYGALLWGTLLTVSALIVTFTLTWWSIRQIHLKN